MTKLVSLSKEDYVRFAFCRLEWDLLIVEKFSYQSSIENFWSAIHHFIWQFHFVGSDLTASKVSAGGPEITMSSLDNFKAETIPIDWHDSI